MTTPVNPQAVQFRDQFYALVPPWLRTGTGERYEYTLNLCSDLLAEKAFQATTIRLPGAGDPSNIPFLAYDRQLVQGPAEPNASFSARLTAAFQAWGEAGSALAVIGQLQAYLQGLQPGVPASFPLLTIVGNSAATAPHNTWNQVLQGTPLGAPPTLSTGQVGFFLHNFDWDGNFALTWRAWLILPMAQVPTGLAGSSAQVSTSAPSACFTSPGRNVNGVWVPAVAGTPVNYPWVTVTGLSGLPSTPFLNAAGNPTAGWITMTGSANSGNNGCFQIVTILSPTSCVIANPSGVPFDAGPLTWSVGTYPFVGPGPAWGAPGVVFGQGELQVPAVDTGSNFGGVWQPSSIAPSATGTMISWGLNCSAQTIVSIRQILKAWKSAGTYYPNIIVAFDAGSGEPGAAYSPYSEPGSGNPDGTFGSVGKLVNGVWVPSRIITSPWTCYCQGTGIAQNCSVENLS